MELYTEPLRPGQQGNISFYTAKEAFLGMGFECIEVEDWSQVELEDAHICLGGIPFMHEALSKLDIAIPTPLDYPEALEFFLGREIRISSINAIAQDPSQWDVFVKPKGYAKKFTGRWVRGTRDLVGCGDKDMDTPVWVSEPKSFVAEWRVFVRYGRVLGVRPYKGDWRAVFHYKTIEEAVEAYKDAPAGYALDFGLTKDGEFLLVEANDGFSLGSYGLFYVDYAKLLAARWAELTRQVDLCDF